MSNLDVWYAHIDVERAREQLRATQVDKAQAKRSSRRRSPRPSARTACAPSRSSPSRVDGEPRFVSDPPLLVPIERAARRGRRTGARRRAIRALLATTATRSPHDRRTCSSQYRFVDLARKVVGVGSVGTRAWIVLLLGRDERDPLFLQVKEAQPSVLEPFTGAERVRQPRASASSQGQRLMQAASDILLGWLPRDRARRRQPRLLRAPALGREGLGRHRDDGRRRAARSTRGCAAGRSRAPTPARATASRSPPTSAAARRFDQAIAELRRRLRRPERARLRRAGGRPPRAGGSPCERGV